MAPELDKNFLPPQGIAASVFLDDLKDWVDRPQKPTLEEFNALLAEYRGKNAGTPGINFSLNDLMGELNSEIYRLENTRLLSTHDGQIVKHLQDLVAEALGPEA